MTETKQIRQQTTRDFLNILFIKKRIFLLTFFGVFLGALILSLIVPPVYQSDMQLIVKPYNAKPLIFDEDSTRMNVYNEVSEKSLNTVINMLKAPEVLRQVVLIQHLADENDEEAIIKQIDKLSRNLKAEPLTLSSIVAVTLKGGDPKLIVAQLNTLVDVFIRHYIAINQETKGRLEFFTQQADYFHKRYDEINQKMIQDGRSKNIIDPLAQKEAGLAIIRDLETNKMQLSSQIVTLTSRIEAFKRALQNGNNSSVAGLPSELVVLYPALVEMEKSLAQLNINVQRATNDFQPSSKQVQDSLAQVDAMKAQIRRSVMQVISDLEVQVASLKRSIDDVDGKIATTHNNGLILSGDAALLEQVAIELKLAKDNYLLYSAKKEEARISQERDRARFANVSVSNQPSIPLSPIFPKKGMIVGVSLIVGLLLAMAFSTISYALEQRLWAATDIKFHCDLPVLGTFDAVGNQTNNAKSRL